jgi:hypothetical protein
MSDIERKNKDAVAILSTQRQTPSRRYALSKDERRLARMPCSSPAILSLVRFDTDIIPQQLQAQFGEKFDPSPLLHAF